MTIYIILYSFLLFSICFEKNSISAQSKNNILVFWVIVFTLFRGLRWNTGTDWNQYLMVFQYADWSSIFSFNRGFGTMEPGYMFINTLVRSLGGDYTVFLILTNLFVLIAYMKFAQTNSQTPIYVFVLIMFSTQFFPVRIGIAVAFIMLGMCNFSEKKYIRVAIFTFLAISVHKSALLFIPVYFLIFFRKIPTMLAVAISLSALIISQLGKVQELLQPLSVYVEMFGGGDTAAKYEHYFEYNDLEKSGGQLIRGVSTTLNSVIFIITLVLFGKMIDKLFPKRTKDRLPPKRTKINYAFMYNVYFAFVMIGILFSSDEMSSLKRMQNHLMFAFPILFSLFIVYGKKNYSKVDFVFTWAFIAYVLFRAYTLFFSGYLGAHFPYKSIFD